MKKLVKIFCFIFLTFLALTFFVTIVRGKVEYFTYSVCKGEDKIYFVGRDGILYAIEGREGKISWKLPLTQSWKEESFENPPICEEKNIFVIGRRYSKRATIIHKIESSGKILWTKNIIGYTSYANVSGYIIVYDDEKIFLVNKETGEVNSYEFRSFGNTVSPSSQGIVDFISFHNAKDKTLIFTVNVEFYETRYKYRKVGSVVFDVESGEKRYKEIKFDKNFLSFLYDYPEIWVVFDDEVAGFDENGKFFSFRITNCETCLYRVNRNGNYLIVSGDGIILVLDVEKGVKVCEKNISFLEVKYYHGSNISDGYSILDISSCEVKFSGSNIHFYDGKYAYFFEPSFVPSGEEYFSLCCDGEIDKPAVYYPEKLIKFDVEEKRIEYEIKVEDLRK